MISLSLQDSNVFRFKKRGDGYIYLSTFILFQVYTLLPSFSGKFNLSNKCTTRQISNANTEATCITCYLNAFYLIQRKLYIRSEHTGLWTGGFKASCSTFLAIAILDYARRHLGFGILGENKYGSGKVVTCQS